MEQRLSQTLSLLQQQSLTLLTLPIPELREYLSQQIHDYPLLELSGQGTESLTALVEEFEEMAAPSEDDLPWSEYSSTPQETATDPLLLLKRPQTFTDDLLLQLAGLELSPLLRRCCMYIIYSLSPRGYLVDSEEELSRQTGVPLEDIQQAVYAVQSLTPTGVGAHDLSECLVLQLVESKQFNPYTIRIVKDHLDDLAAGRYGKISTALGIPRQETEYWCAQIRRLNPIPSKGYASDRYVQPVIPEASVSKELVVTMNQIAVPAIVMAEEYRTMLSCVQEASVRKFLQNNQQQAKNLTAQLDRRQKTLLEVISCIVRLQPDYFRLGQAHLLPMTMQQVADQLSLHVSTVSRAVSGKYIDTAWGPVALRSLFTSALSDASAGGVKTRLLELIRLEDATAPLSDNDLCALLEAQQISISRRTVAKYRNELNILPASLRRRRSDRSSKDCCPDQCD